MKSRVVVVLLILLLAKSQTGMTQSKLSVLKFSQEDCESREMVRQLRRRIFHQTYESGILTIQVGAWAICCLEFDPLIKMKKDTLLLDIVEQFASEPCECSCYYKFNYKIGGLKSEPAIVKFHNKIIRFSNEKYVTYRPTYEIVNNDTVNYTDKYGLRQGKWIEPKKLTLPDRYTIYKNGLRERVVSFSVTKRILRETLYEIVEIPNEDPTYGNRIISIEYYFNGNKKEECEYFDRNWDKGTCKQWDVNGVLVVPVK